VADATTVYGDAPKLTGDLGQADTAHQPDTSYFEIFDNTNNKIVTPDELHANGDYTIRYTDAAKKNLNADNNYQFDNLDSTAKLTVTKRPVTVTAANISKVYGSTDPELSLTDDSAKVLVNNDDLSSLGVTLNREDGKDATTYQITGAPSSANYDVTILPGTFTITRADADATISAATVVYGDDMPTFTGNLGQVKDDHPTIEQSDFEVVDESGKVVQAKDLQAGKIYHIQYTDAKQAALKSNSNYTYNNFGTAILTVHPRPITVNATNNEKTYGSTDPTLGFSIDEHDRLGNSSDDLGIKLVRDAGENVRTYKINQDSSETLNGNYTIAFNPGTFTINKKDITVTINPVEKTYGDADPELTFTNPALVGDDNVDALGVTLTRDQGQNDGTYAIIGSSDSKI